MEGEKISITEEDKDTVLDSIVMDLLIEVLERDINAVKNSNIKIKEPYLKLLEKTLTDAINKKKDIKSKMRKLGLKIYSTEPVNEDFVEYKYLARGYESQMRMFRHALRNYVRDKLNSYFHFK